VIVLVTDEEFWSLVVSAAHPDIVVFLGEVEFTESPIDDAKLALVVVNHDVLRFDISMHDA